MPVGLLLVALDQLDRNGANTSAVRAEFMEAGFDLSSIPHRAQPDDLRRSNDPQSAGERSGSRVPKVIAAAILAKYQEGWSKSRIAREFRLNRRTIIRICQGADDNSIMALRCTDLVWGGDFKSRPPPPPQGTLVGLSIPNAPAS